MQTLSTLSARTTLAAVLISATPVAVADISGSVEAGILMSSGNSDSTSANAGFSLEHTSGKWINEFSAKAFSASQETEVAVVGGGTESIDETTAENYAVGARSAFNFNEHSYLFGEATWKKDLFAGVRESTTEALGYGRRLINQTAHKLDLELGAGARQQETQTGETSSDAIGRGGLKYKWVISDTSEFSQRFLVESGDENTYSESVTGLKLSVIGPTFVNLTYTVKNNSDVPTGTEKTDTFLAVNLSYAFGG